MSEPRSWLFVPADSEKKIAKALDSDADAIIFDLEDSVAPVQKAAARDILRNLPKQSTLGPHRVAPLERLPWRDWREELRTNPSGMRPPQRAIRHDTPIHFQQTGGKIVVLRQHRLAEQGS